MVARDPCSAKRRDGWPCQALAIEFGRVCLKHGGAAPQTQVAAQRMRLQFALYCATEDWRAEQDGKRGFDLLCKISAAERALERFEAKVVEVAELRESIARHRAARGESHLPPWQPSPEDLAVLGIRPKRQRPEGAQGRTASRDRTPETAVAVRDSPSAGEAAPAVATEPRFVRPGAEGGPSAGRVQRPPWG
jgi:hypothetical protein